MKRTSSPNASAVALLIAAVSFTLASSNVLASKSSTNWVGPSVGYWSDANNWNDTVHGHQVPQDGTPTQFDFHTVFISTGAAVTMDVANAAVNEVFLTNNSSLNISSFNSLKISGFLGGIAGSVFVQNGGYIESFDTGPIFTGTIKLQSVDALTEYKAQAQAFANYFQNYSDIYLAGLADTSHDRLDGVSASEEFRNYNTVRGAGEIFGFDTFTNLGTVSGGGQTARLLTITTNTFNNQGGTLKVLPNGGLRIEAPSLPNMINNFIKGGTYDIAGRLIITHVDHFNSFIDTDITLRGEAFVTNDGTHNIIYSVDTNRGKLHLTDSTAQLFGNADGLSNEDNGLVTIDGNAKLTVANRYTNGAPSLGTVVGTQNGATISPGTLKAAGLQNNGKLTVLAGTADFRGNTLDSFINVDSGQEQLTGELYDIGATGTMIVDAGSGTHGGEIMSIDNATTLTLHRGGQFQYGPTAQDALANLRENDGQFNILGGVHTFTPAGGTVTNIKPGSAPAAATPATITVANANTNVTIAGSLNNAAIFKVQDHANVEVLATTTIPRGGQLYSTNAAVFTSDGAVTNDGGVNIDAAQFNAASSFTNHGGAFFENGSFAQSLTTENDGQIYIRGSSTFVTSQTLHNAPNDTSGGLIVGQNNGVGDFAYFATLENESVIYAYKSATLAGSHFHQTSTGQTEFRGASVQVADFAIDGGVVDGYGSIAGEVKNTAGTVEAQDGNIAITGDYSQQSGATLAALIGFDHYLTTTGDVDLAGLLNVTTAPGLSIAPGNSFEVLHFDGTLTGNFTSFNFPVLDGVKLTEVVGPHDITLLAVVPEPTTLLATSFVFAGLVRRRK